MENFVFQTKQTIAKILADKQQRQGSCFEHTVGQSTVSDAVCSTRRNNMHVPFFDHEDSESTPSDLGDISPQSTITILTFIGNEFTPGHKSLPKGFNSVDDYILHTDDDGGEVTEQQLNDRAVRIKMDVMSTEEGVHELVEHTKHMTGVDLCQASFMEMITPVFFVFDEEKMADRTQKRYGMTELSPHRNSLYFEDHTNSQVCKRNTFRISRGVDKLHTNPPVLILSQKTGSADHSITAAMGDEQHSSAANGSDPLGIGCDRH